jgi:hypothetical protein
LVVAVVAVMAMAMVMAMVTTGRILRAHLRLHHLEVMAVQ